MATPQALLDPSSAAGRPSALSDGISPVARAKHAPTDQFRRILLATDLSETSELATRKAIALAAALEATLLAVTVIDPGRLRVGDRPARVDQVRSECERMMADVIAQARRAAIRFEYLIWVGDPSESILESARSESASLIVLGSHGRSGVGRCLIGSVSDEVVRRSSVPVLVVRPSGSPPEGH